jgi:hypothetical protein
METAAPMTAAWTWRPDVLALAAELGVTEYLEPLLEMTRRVFPSLRQLTVRVEEDWEIADERWITFEVCDPSLTADQYLKSQHDWCEALFDLCPAPQVCSFVLALDTAQ